MVSRSVPIIVLVLLGFALPGFGQIERLIPGALRNRSNQRCDAEKGGRLIVVELCAFYGDSAAKPEAWLKTRFRSLLRSDEETGKKNELPGTFSEDKRLWVLIRDRERYPGDDVMFDGSRQTRNGLTEDGQALYWTTKRGDWNTTQESASYDIPGVSFKDFKRWRSRRGNFLDRAEGGYVHLQYGIYIEDGTPSSLPDFKAELSDVVRFLAESIEEKSNVECGFLLLNLARFTSITDLVGTKRAARVLRRANRTVRRARRIQSSNTQSGENKQTYLYDQAALRAGFTAEVKPKIVNSARRRRSDVYVGFRFLAENKAVPSDARVVAFERCLNTPRGIDFHEDWVRMLESGELPMSEPQRQEVIDELKIEIRSKSPFALLILSVSLLGGFIVAIVAVRMISRRLMFSA